MKKSNTPWAARVLAGICCLALAWAGAPWPGVTMGWPFAGTPLAWSPSVALGEEKDWQYWQNIALAPWSYEQSTDTLRIQEGVEGLMNLEENYPYPQIIVLPQSLRNIYAYSLQWITSVREYQVAAGNPVYKAIDGVLYSADGATLLAYPSAREQASYTAAPGCKAVSDHAFYDCQNLRELILPEGVESLQGVFGMPDYSYSQVTALRRLVLPSTLCVATAAQLNGWDLEAIQVSPGNPHFYTTDGVLFDKSGTLIRYPMNKPEEHYDVPPGTTAIGESAFAFQRHLKSVSIPRSVKAIGNTSFNTCAYLERVALPATLETIGEWAFANCVSLEDMALPTGVAVKRRAFFNCTQLPGQQGKAERYQWEPKRMVALANPANAKDTIPLLKTPGSDAAVLGQLTCGAGMTITGREGAYYAVDTRFADQEGGASGYVRADQVQKWGSLTGLFEIYRVGPAPSKDSVERYSTEAAFPQCQHRPHALPQGESLQCNTWMAPQGQMLPVRESSSSGYFFVWVSDVQAYVEHLEPGQRFGLVINDDMRDRLHLRAGPSKKGQSLGKFFSGTQVQILGEEGDWFQVRVGLEEGYMMKEFVREVKEWKE